MQKKNRQALRSDWQSKQKTHTNTTDTLKLGRLRGRKNINEILRAPQYQHTGIEYGVGTNDTTDNFVLDANPKSNTHKKGGSQDKETWSMRLFEPKWVKAPINYKNLLPDDTNDVADRVAFLQNINRGFKKIEGFETKQLNNRKNAKYNSKNENKGNETFNENEDVFTANLLGVAEGVTLEDQRVPDGIVANLYRKKLETKINNTISNNPYEDLSDRYTNLKQGGGFPSRSDVEKEGNIGGSDLVGKAVEDVDLLIDTIGIRSRNKIDNLLDNGIQPEGDFWNQALVRAITMSNSIQKPIGNDLRNLLAEYNGVYKLKKYGLDDNLLRNDLNVIGEDVKKALVANQAQAWYDGLQGRYQQAGGAIQDMIQKLDQEILNYKKNNPLYTGGKLPLNSQAEQYIKNQIENLKSHYFNFREIIENIELQRNAFSSYLNIDPKDKQNVDNQLTFNSVGAVGFANKAANKIQEIQGMVN